MRVHVNTLSDPYNLAKNQWSVGIDMSGIVFPYIYMYVPREIHKAMSVKALC